MVHHEPTAETIQLHLSSPGFKSEKSPLSPLPSNPSNHPHHDQRFKCAGCGLLILDRYYLQALDRQWHSQCLKCSICSITLDSHTSCFSKNGKIYCKSDYYKSITKCSRCNETILPPNDLVIRLSTTDQLYHVSCFTCIWCNVTLSQGDYFGSDGQFIFCRTHFTQCLSGKVTQYGNPKPINQLLTQRDRVPTPNDGGGSGFSHLSVGHQMSSVATSLFDTRINTTSDATPPPFTSSVSNDCINHSTHCINHSTRTVYSPHLEQSFGEPLIGQEQTNVGTIEEQEPNNGRKKQRKKMTGQKKCQKRKVNNKKNNDQASDKQTEQNLKQNVLEPQNVESQNLESQNPGSQNLDSRNLDTSGQTVFGQITFDQISPSQTADPNLGTGFTNQSLGVNYCLRSKRMRTSFKHHQLKQMKSYFAINHNPDSKELKGLSLKTGLSKRVLQVWFQNARAKWRRSVLRQESNGPHIVSEATSLLDIQSSQNSSYQKMAPYQDSSDLRNSWFYERHLSDQEENKNLGSAVSMLTEHFSIDSSSSTDILCEDQTYTNSMMIN